MRIVPLLLLLALLLSFFAAKSQEKYTLRITADNKSLDLDALTKYKTFSGSAAVIKGLDSVMASIRFRGFLLAEIDTLIWNEDRLFAAIETGRQFFLIRLKNGNVAGHILKSTGLSERMPQNKPFDQDELTRLFHKLLRAYENQGYPFAAINLDSIQIQDTLISASIYADPGKSIQMDSIHIAGSASVSARFLENYLGIKPGFPYQEELIASVDERLGKLSFIELAKPSQVSFVDDKARMTIFLNKKNANRFDGILGLAPEGGSGKMRLTGNLSLQLQNAFRNAEQLGFNFKSFSEQGRELDLHLAVPFVFSSPIGIGVDLDLYKQDTSFQNITFRGTAAYAVSAEKKLGFYVESRDGSTFTFTDTVIPGKDYAGLKSTLYGMTYQYKKLDNWIAPSKGIAFLLDGSAGLKKSMLRNEGRGGKKLSQYRLAALFDYYLPLGNRGVFRLENQSALLSGRRLYANELYRIGGFELLRGFDEKSIEASCYSVFNAEYRYMIERQSFLFVFCNQGFVQRKTISISETDTPIGYGAGLNLETKAGIFSISYALGKQKNIPVNLRLGKIHFGLIALF